MISKHILEITFLNKPKFKFSTQLNGFKNFHQTRIILFIINYLLVISFLNELEVIC